jgi:hypothetical protein
VVLVGQVRIIAEFPIDSHGRVEATQRRSIVLISKKGIGTFLLEVLVLAIAHRLERMEPEIDVHQRLEQLPFIARIDPYR